MYYSDILLPDLGHHPYPSSCIPSRLGEHLDRIPGLSADNNSSIALRLTWNWASAQVLRVHAALRTHVKHGPVDEGL